MQQIVWITALLAVLTTSAAMASKIYKWNDAQGQTHYGELPPVGRSAQALDIQTSPDPKPSASSPPAAPPGTSPSPNNQEAAVQPSGNDRHAHLNADAAQPACSSARNNLQFLQAGGSNRRFRDPSGKVVRYTQAQREAQIAAAKHYLEEHCPPDSP